ncbi:MAG TPA: hypothetical protein VGX28_13560 [Frankiaceae bacterium]|jgi:hypothetical protein|nr:hypothetical protein [Frankiaceae bacterium]
MRSLIARALVASALVATPFLATTSAGATANACTNQEHDVDIIGIGGIDQYDPPTTGNGMLAVCHPYPGRDTFSGVRVDSDSSGICVAVIIAGKSYGCASSVEGA